MIDKLIDCPCCHEQKACYSTPINEFHNSYICFNCGFTTTDLMVEGEFDFEEYESGIPELYKDIKRVDSEHRVWYPHVVNIIGKGTVFANGKSADNWFWSSIKSIPLTEDEKKNTKFKNQTHKSDSASLTNFGNDYIEALDSIGFFEL